MTVSTPLAHSSRIAVRILASAPRRSSGRCFSSTARAAAASTKNRIYTSIRTPDELSNLLLISASTRRPLLTLWSASWCQSCKVVEPLVRSLIEEDGVGEAQGGVGYAKVEVDAATIGDLPITYRITSMPTLMAFDRQEAQFDTRITKVDDMKDKRYLIEWIQKEASRRGEGGAGGKSILGKWFG